MVRKRAHERWETNLANSEFIPQTTWPIAKSLTKRGGPKAPPTFHGPLDPIFYPIDKAYIIALCLENLFRAHDMCDCDHRRHVEAPVETLLATTGEDTPLNFRPCDVSKVIHFLKLGTACVFDGIPN
jgi:hypothetical protein